MTAKALQCVVAAVAFTAIACGGGGGEDGNEPLPDGSDEVECGDGTCTAGNESFSSCPQDCPAVVNCGNGACDGDESCTLCAQDCGGCPVTCGDRTCDGDENCTTCVQDCGCGDGEVCHPTEHACRPISTNPLIESMPGTWILVEPNTGFIAAVTVDPTQPTCGCPEQPPGDACVIGFDPPNFAVLLGTRLTLSACGQTLDGEVLGGGTRVEYDRSDDDGNSGRFAWEKQE